MQNNYRNLFNFNMNSIINNIIDFGRSIGLRIHTVDSYENDHHFSLKCAHCSYSKVDSVILPYLMTGFSRIITHQQ